jgi:hypothetical protein
MLVVLLNYKYDVRRSSLLRRSCSSRIRPSCDCLDRMRIVVDSTDSIQVDPSRNNASKTGPDHSGHPQRWLDENWHFDFGSTNKESQVIKSPRSIH